MLILPAIDLRNGKCVRLVEGKVENETIYSDNPAEMAVQWQSKGAKMLHLVDLDGAFAGSPQNLASVQQILTAINIPVELGGGIRDMATVEMVLDLGVQRVILGSAAINNPQLVKAACAKYGERIVLGVDAKNGMVAIHGWGETATKSAVELALEMKEFGVARVIFTDISRDGTHKGINIESTRELAEKTGLAVIASGGVSTLADIEAVKDITQYGVEGVITGKAIYDGTIQLEAALKIAEKVTT